MQRNELTPNMIAEAIGVTLPHLWRIARNVDRHYNPRRTTTIKGKPRPIDPPKHQLKRWLRKLHRYLQRECRPPRAVHGGAKGRSCVTAANVHKGQSFIITRDIENCYPSVTTAGLQAALVAIGFRRDSSILLSLLMTNHGILPHGSPVSGDALNLFLLKQDRWLERKCRRSGIRYSRTCDDFVASGASRQDAHEAGTLLEGAILSTGLCVNAKKKKKQGLQPCHSQQRVHNLIVNSKRGVAPPAEQK